MINIFLFLAVLFLLTFLIGRILEKFRVPWIFAALILGALISVYNPFNLITSSETFNFLAQLGMYFLLFLIGFQLDLKKFKKQGRFILRSTISIILLEAFFGTLIVHFVFGYGWVVSLLVALSFATVGEAILIPILEEFKIVNKKLGQTIIGIGTFDDIIEVLTLVFAVLLIGTKIHKDINVFLILASLLVLFLLTVFLSRFKGKSRPFKFLGIEDLFFFVVFIFFLFLGIGEYALAAPIGALLAGISLRNFIPEKYFENIEKIIKGVSYGFFGPIFFLWVGLSMDLGYVVAYPLLILLVIFFSGGSKILGGYILGKKELGTKKSILMGIGLSIRFSTSIIIVKILYENSLIGLDLYSVLIASSIIFTLIIPPLFSNLLSRLKDKKD